MNDLISRQAAIAHAVPLNLFGREVMMVSVSELENLPPAQPETNCPEIPDSSDAISRQDAIEAINLWLYCDKDERMPADVIKALPSVQTEIIHCKDCLYKKICSWKNQGAEFCSFGKRGNADGTD